MDASNESAITTDSLDEMERYMAYRGSNTSQLVHIKEKRASSISFDIEDSIQSNMTQGSLEEEEICLNEAFYNASSYSELDASNASDISTDSLDKMKRYMTEAFCITASESESDNTLESDFSVDSLEAEVTCSKARRTNLWRQ